MRLLLCQVMVTEWAVWLTAIGWDGGPGRARGSDGARLNATFGLMGFSTSKVAVQEETGTEEEESAGIATAQQVYVPESSTFR